MRRRRAALLGVGIALALAAVVPGAASAGPPLTWEKCPQDPPPYPPLHEDVLCTTVTVPLDYADPGGRTIEVALARIPAQDPSKRRGALLLNSGGPGGDGLYLPNAFAGNEQTKQLADHYDLVGFDPRGIGRSAGVTCNLTPEQMDATRFPAPFPAPGGFAENVAYARGFADACAKASTADTLPFMTTANTARDMDRIRAALGEQSISYYGPSYGTYLGAVYTTLFSEHVDRFVLDSNVHPDWIWRDQFRSWGPGGEQRFGDIARWIAARHATYGLGATADAVRERYVALAAKLDKDPLDLGEGGLLTGNLFRFNAFATTYSDSQFPAFADLFKLASDARPNRTKLRARVAALPDPPYDNAYTSTAAVICDDAQWPEDPAAYERDIAIDGARYPLFGAMASNIWPCAFWPEEPRERPVTIAPLRAPGRALLLQNERDPATPYPGGPAMRQRLGDRTRLVSVRNGGHGVAYGDNRQRCSDEATTAFLVDGVLPPHDIWCAPDHSKQRGRPVLKLRPW